MSEGTIPTRVIDLIDDLEEKLNIRIDATEKLMCSRIESLEKASIVAKTAMDYRLAGMNEFRESLKDQTSTMWTRQEHNIYESRIAEDIEELKEAMHRSSGKAEQSSVNLALAISLSGLLLGVISLIMSIIRG